MAREGRTEECGSRAGRWLGKLLGCEAAGLRGMAGSFATGRGKWRERGAP